MSVLIRAFGTKEQANNAQELLSILSRKFRNQSVAIQYKKPSGISSSVFVDVNVLDKQSEIQVVDSYTNQLINLHSLFT